jgi:hypothetical protein
MTDGHVTGLIPRIRVLHIVATEERNSRRVRECAIEQLHQIERTLGAKQAGTLAEQAEQALRDTF